jgi:hypothetical protein
MTGMGDTAMSKSRVSSDAASEMAVMSQRSVEILLGKLLTDEAFRRSFFPVRAASFELAAAKGLELTEVERQALASLDPWRVQVIAESLDPRLARLSIEGAGDPGGERHSS